MSVDRQTGRVGLSLYKNSSSGEASQTSLESCESLTIIFLNLYKNINHIARIKIDIKIMVYIQEFKYYLHCYAPLPKNIIKIRILLLPSLMVLLPRSSSFLPVALCIHTHHLTSE